MSRKSGQIPRFVMALAAMVSPAFGQVIRGGGNPYSSQLVTDPDAGTIQGIQQYGRPLAADPEQGGGYPYHVFPSVRNPRLSSPFSGSPTVRLSPFQQQQLRQNLQRIQSLRQRYRSAEASEEPSAAADATGQTDIPIAGPDNPGVDPPGSADPSGQGGNGAAAALRNQALQLLLNGLPATPNYTTNWANRTMALAAPSAPVFVPGRTAAAATLNSASTPHQPLIQVKLRVVEVTRNDNLAVGSTLDYIRNQGAAGTSDFENRMNVANINSGQRNLTGISRFPIAGLANVPNDAASLINGPTGAGALVNLTSRHLNWIASMLANELEADVLTAPELVTTNGEGVEFVAGSRSPFVLGTVRTSAETENNVFYKHVGTYIQVTPRIINFGTYGTGNGDAPVVAPDVRDWNLLIRFLLNEGFVVAGEAAKVAPVKDETEEAAKRRLVVAWQPFTRPGRLVPLEIKTQVLDLVNQFTRTDLRAYALERAAQDPGFEFEFYEMICRCDDGGCGWRPEDCVIDLEILARFSNKEDAGEFGVAGVTVNPDDLATLTTEGNVRAVSNIVQLKAGTGLVMAGLLGESDVETVAKVPVLGDIPGVGSLFRAKSVSRAKTEILIFIEADILADDPNLARAESGADLHLAAPYVTAGTLDNPLEVGLYRAGFGSYLPPPTQEEKQYWERSSRRINRIKTTRHDALR